MSSVRTGAALLVRLLLGFVRVWSPYIWLLTVVAVVLRVLGQISWLLLGFWLLLSAVTIIGRVLLRLAAIRIRSERDLERH